MVHQQKGQGDTELAHDSQQLARRSGPVKRLFGMMKNHSEAVA
jgi:hypothetical protein